MPTPDIFEDLVMKHFYSSQINPDIELFLEQIRQISVEIEQETIKNHIHRAENTRHLLRFAHAGVMGVDLPEQYKGAGGNYLDYIRTLVAIGEFSGSQDIPLDIEISHVVQTILLNYGSEAQKQHLLPSLAQGYLAKRENLPTENHGFPIIENMDLVIASFGQTEPSNGSDARNLKSTLIPSKMEEEYIANGRKRFITNWAPRGFTVYNLNQNVGPNGIAIVEPRGQPIITSVIVPNSSPGHRLERIEEMMGHVSSITGERTLENVVVKASDIIGNPGKGFKYFMQGLDEGRYGIAATLTGALIYALKKCRSRVLERKQFGEPIINYAQVREKLAMLEGITLASRLMLYHGANQVDLGNSITYHAALTKHFVSKYGNRALEQAILIFGGEGYAAETGLSRTKDDAILDLIGEGTDDIIGIVASKNKLKSLETLDWKHSIDLKLESYRHEGENLKLFRAISDSEKIISTIGRTLIGYSEDKRSQYFNMFTDLLSQVEATKMLLDFGVNLQNSNHPEANRVLAMAQRMGLKMAQVTANNGNQILLGNEQIPIFNSASIYSADRLKLETQITQPHAQILSSH